MQIFPDNACRREILSLDVECDLKGCKWIGKLKDLDVSVKIANYNSLACGQPYITQTYMLQVKVTLHSRVSANTRLHVQCIHV